MPRIVVVGECAASQQRRTDGFDVKINYQATSKDQLSARYSFMRPTAEEPGNFANNIGGPYQGGFVGTGVNTSYSVAGNWVRTWTNSLVMDVRAGVMSYHNEALAQGNGQNTATEFGIPGANLDFYTSGMTQINIANGAVVDRCESCHLGIREPLTLTKDKNSIGDPLFISHPNKDLLTIHDPEQFGCSTCHGGNGRGTTSKIKGHGRYKHWLWPLYYKENVQAGCNQCHNRDRVTPMADVLNEGKNLFQNKGCVGCHRGAAGGLTLFGTADSVAAELVEDATDVVPRRIEADAALRSLLLCKPLIKSDPNSCPHEGGAFLVSSDGRYQALLRWVTDHAPNN